ncbi:UDP-N-acetylglucosamine 2-epimerase (non-hydrolyzing) [Salinirubellus salinus]|uniref:UDP-N-acetylglucosamine 2-epimerase (Non-hydrolyzing) n=1 Tax=Salinirubellus salinus TaxID=1364945 RepID=A0A9E7R223_9EURY|nr:UDP-N-acetylglucosamine 2-epimerase (non-hydrolyzing) [Salinirubellus salinus]UWM54321.1 UDP-N-acetylglucosamine 2-epimerase (non-hydrolyzing) [Salinirubellus salinus]
MKVLTVVGARPQFVKGFTVSRVLRSTHEEVLVHTGQHYDEELSGHFFAELDLPTPDYNLGVGSHSHAEQTARMLAALEEPIAAEEPDVVLTYGDTNSTVAAAMATAKLPPRLAHVEAGLRAGDRSIPEEVNRIVTDHVSDLLFAPTASAVRNLRREGITTGVHDVGDVMYDAMCWARERATDRSGILDELGLEDGQYVLATVHRQRNTEDGSRLETIVSALAESPLPVVFPAHPRTVERLHELGRFGKVADAISLVDPVGYLDFVRLLTGAERVVTDSGGVQKEAFFLDVPCVTLREETEWTETVDCGWNVLVGADGSAIREALSRPFDLDPDRKPTPFGDGDAADRIVRVLEDA